MRPLIAFCLGIHIFLGLNVSAAEPVDRIIAIVNDEIVTESDLKSTQKNLKTEGLVDGALLSLYDAKAVGSDRAKALEYLVDLRIVDSEIRRQGIVIPIEQVESEIRTILRDAGTSREALLASLKRQGVGYAEYQDFIKTSLQRQSLLQREVRSKIKVSDEDVNAYYIANFSKQKALVFEYTLAHIVFLEKNGGKKSAEQRANDVRAKLGGNQSFEALAAQFSEDPEFVQGGVFGTFKVTDFKKDIQPILSQLNAGDISPAVEMPDGYHIFKVIKKTLVPSPELEAQRNKIMNILAAENFKHQYSAWIQSKRRDAYIKINK